MKHMALKIMVMIILFSWLIFLATTHHIITRFAVNYDSSAENMQQEKIVIIRDDDVSKLDPGLEWLSEFAINNDLKITYAVIPGKLQSNTIDYLNLINYKNNFELASHGYEHEEFKELPYNVQYALISKATSFMEEYFGSRPYTFIPPCESSDANTLKACAELGYHSISSRLKNYLNMLSFPPDFEWEIYSAISKKMVSHRNFSDFKSSFDKFYNSPDEKFYIMYMHHETWQNKSGKINETLAKTFEDSINYIKEKDAKFMTYEQAYKWHVADRS